MFNKFFNKNSDAFYLVFRVIVGLLFVLHGTMKFGAISSGQVSLMSLAFIIEVIGGICIILGLYTREVALIAGLEMIIAYFKVHASRGLSPLANGGEPAVLFFAAFLVLMAYGAGKYSLDRRMKR